MKKFVIKLLLIAILLELTIFNMNFYRAKLFNGKEISFNEEELIEKTTISNEYQVIELDNLNTKVKNLYIEIDNLPKNNKVKYDILYSDETTVGLDAGSKEYVNHSPKTQNTILSLSGKVSAIGIRVYNNEANVTSIKINSPYPFSFYILRIMLIVAIGAFIYSLKYNSFWNHEYKDWKTTERCAISILVNVSIIIIAIFNDVNYSSVPDLRKDFYSRGFVDALSKGQLYLDDKPKEELTSLDNPYDYVERVRNGLSSANGDYIWDAALYNGRYYVYFGVLPAATIMVPFHLITHKYLPTGYVELLFTALAIIGFAFLMTHIYKKYFEKVKFKYYFASLAMLIWGTLLVWVNIAPRFYELVAVSGMCFTIWGVYLILSCKHEEYISYPKLIFGCLAMALAVACRPTMLLTSIVIAPILINILIKGFKEKKGIKNLLAIGIPYALVGIALMVYNYLRFGSPFDFGINYQLTMNDTTHLSFRPITILVGLFTDLFNFPTIKPVFPFIFTNRNILNTFTYYYVEDMPGGVFFMAPICFAIFGIRRFMKSNASKDLKQLVTMLLITGLVLIITCSVKAGSTGRYLLDFSWLFVLSGIIIFMEILNGIDEKEEKWASKIFASIVIYTLVLNFLTGFSTIGSHSMSSYSPSLFYGFQNTLMFWL